MNLRSIAAKNVWHSRGRYVAYLASAAFSVMIYFLYTALAQHPQLQGGYRGAGYAMHAVKAASVVIAIFTFLFLLYSGAAFVRARMKEFGLLMLMGLSKRQLVRMILWENLVIAAAALAVGLGAGLLFLKLFFMVISLMLHLPQALPAYAGWSVWRQTLVVFGSFFVVVSFLSLRSVLRRSVVELIKAGRQPKANPSFSRGKALLGLILVAGGYVWASVPNPTLVVLGVIPVTAMVSFGTYLLMREGSIAFLHWLHGRKRFFYRPRPFLIVSQMMFKMQDNFRVLSAVAVVVAVLLSAVGTVFSFYVVMEADALTRSPQAIQLVWAGGRGEADELGQSLGQGGPEQAEIEGAVRRVQATLTEHGVTHLRAWQGILPKAKLGETAVVLVPHSLYAGLYRPEGEVLPLQAEHDAVLVHPFSMPERVRLQRAGEAPKEQRLWLGDTQVATQVTLRVRQDYSGRLFNDTLGDVNSLVLADTTFARLATGHSHESFGVALWTGADWRTPGAQAAVRALRDQFPEGGAIGLTTTLEMYHGLVGEAILLLFIGVFVSLVFFAASCSLLYFRLFTEIEEDRRYYRRLQQVGLHSGELKRIARLQTAVIFFVPFGVGFIHSLFAMRALGTLVMKTVLHYGGFIALGYLGLYALYFLATYALYWRTLKLSQLDQAVAL